MYVGGECGVKDDIDGRCFDSVVSACVLAGLV
jgi:hypothetical protein